MANYVNDNSDKYIVEKFWWKYQGQRTLNQLKIWNDYLKELLKQKKRPQDIAIENTLEKVKEKILGIIMGPLSKLWVMVEEVNSGRNSFSTVGKRLLHLNF